MSISKEIERIQQAKKDIGDAIVRKGGSVSGTIDTYAKSVMALGDVSFRTAIDIVNKSDAKNVDLTMISPKNETSLNKLFNGINIVNLNVSTWDTSSITSLVQVFSGAPNIESVECAEWNVSNVTRFYATFDGLKRLKNVNISNWDTTKSTTFDCFFSNNNSLQQLDVSNLKTQNCSTFYSMFGACHALQQLDVSKFNMANARNTHSMFGYCVSITSLDISNFDLSNVKDVDYMFRRTEKLTTLKTTYLKLPNIDMGLIGFNGSPLTVDSIVGLLNALPQSDKGYSFQIGSDNIAKLSDEQKAIATNKGWTLI